MSQDRTGPIIHVRENSDTELEALFNIAMNPSLAETNKYVPLRERNLPASFFCPPEPPKQMQQQIGVGKDNPTDAPVFHGAVNPSINIAHMRAHSSPASLQQSLSAAPPPASSSHVRQHSYDALDEEPLPTGWDMARTPQGQRYYLNHVLQITTWNDPRKTHNTGNPGTLSSTSNNNNNANTANLNSSPQTGVSSLSSQPPLSSTPINVDKVPLPPGWERAYTADLEVYFINHIDRTTSWFHPSVPTHLQRPGMKFQQQQQQQQLSSGPMSPQQDRLKHLKLQQLQMEQERLKKRQDEIALQEMALRAQVGEAVLGTSGDITAISQSTEMTSITDPFFGQAGTSDHHSRQESGDSGLGGMGTSYSLPRTPDFLGNMEDMDTQDGGPKLQGQSDFGSMDMAGVGDVVDHLTMDSEDLVPSLQEEINSELLKDVERVLGNKDNALTWL
ncbi:hypothetical protein BsWGS_09178 [Bradybaena similaris]